MGAGAAIELHQNDGKKPTTEHITSSILNEQPTYLNPDGTKSNVTVINRIFNHLCQKHHGGALNPNSKDSRTEYHFEVLFHVIEELITYCRSWSRGTNSALVAPFSAFVLQSFGFNRNHLFTAWRHIIDVIFRIVRNYDDYFGNKDNDWYRNFWKQMKNDWDIFNLNYDTTVEQSLGDFEDGFNDIPNQKEFQRFSILKLINNAKSLSTINHLHGCIHYGYDRYKDINHDVYDYQHSDMYKWPNSEIAYKRWSGMATSNETAQNGQEIIQGPIITGLSKTEKVTCLPYDIYRFNFERSIIRNKSLLIIGYSFGDKYINDIFYRLMQVHGNDARVVIIDYWNLSNFFHNEEAGSEEVLTDDMLSPRLLEKSFELDYGNDEELMFIKRVAHSDLDVWLHFDKLSLTRPMISDNGRLMLCIGGFKYTIENYQQEILDFLR